MLISFDYLLKHGIEDFRKLFLQVCTRRKDSFDICWGGGGGDYAFSACDYIVKSPNQTIPPLPAGTEGRSETSAFL